MPRFLAVGHVTWDRLEKDKGEILGGSVTYAAQAAQKLGWESAILTCAGPDFDAGRDLPGVEVFLSRGSATTRFFNRYDADGERHQTLSARANDIDLVALPERWRDPDVLLLAPVADEIRGALAPLFNAEVVGAAAQGWLRSVDEDGTIAPSDRLPDQELSGVHVLFLSDRDLPQADSHVPRLLQQVPMLGLTRGWKGFSLFTREGNHAVGAWPRPEVDPTGAGDVFAAAFLIRYQETGDLTEASAFAVCAASCAVEGSGTSTLGDRFEVVKRMTLRDQMIEDGEWEE